MQMCKCVCVGECFSCIIQISYIIKIAGFHIEYRRVFASNMEWNGLCQHICHAMTKGSNPHFFEK